MLRKRILQFVKSLLENCDSFRCSFNSTAQDGIISIEMALTVTRNYNITVSELNIYIMIVKNLISKYHYLNSGTNTCKATILSNTDYNH